MTRSKDKYKAIRYIEDHDEWLKAFDKIQQEDKRELRTIKLTIAIIAFAILALWIYMAYSIITAS